MQRELEQSKLRSEQLGAVGRIVSASVSYLEQVEQAAVASSLKQMTEAASAARGRGALLSNKDSAAAKQAFERATAYEPENPINWMLLGDAAMTLGDTSRAGAAYQRAHLIANDRVLRDPQNTQWQRDLIVSHVKIGNMLVANNNASEGLGWLDRAHAVATRLTQIDPSNATWSRDLTIIEKRIAGVRAK